VATYIATATAVLQTDRNAQTSLARNILFAWSSCSAFFAGSPLSVTREANGAGVEEQ
jgi:hypothetical protein